MSSDAPQHPWSLVPQRFCSFLAALRPAVRERQAAFEAARAVNGLLRRRFPDVACGMAPLLIGSHAKDTAIAGAASVDLLFPLPLRSDRRGRNTDDQPAVLVDTVTAMLAARFGAVTFSRLGSLGIETVDGHGLRQGVRVLPVTPAAAGGFVVGAAPSDSDDGPFIIDPRIELKTLIRVDRATGGKARDLVRLLKAWRRAAAVPLPSLALDSFACEFLEVWLYRRRSLLFYDWMVRDFFFWLSAQADRGRPVPGAAYPLSLPSGWQEAAWRAYEHADAASAMERDGDGRGALTAWRQIFGRGFATPPQPMRIESLPNGRSASKAANAAGT